MEDEQEEVMVVDTKMVDVQVVKAGDKQTLVQWLKDGNLHRATVANGKIKDGKVKEDDLKKAIPYGLDFAEIIKDFAMPDEKAIELAFHNHGIWTAGDVRTSPQQVIAALSSIYSPILRSLTQYIRAKKI